MTNVRFVFLACSILMVFAQVAVAGPKNSPAQPQHATGKTRILECGALPGVLGAHFDLEVETQTIKSAVVKRSPGAAVGTATSPVAEVPQHEVRVCTVIRRAGDSEALRISLPIREEPMGKVTHFRAESEDGDAYSATVMMGDQLSAKLEMSTGTLQCKDQSDQ